MPQEAAHLERTGGLAKGEKRGVPCRDQDEVEQIPVAAKVCRSSASRCKLEQDLDCECHTDHSFNHAEHMVCTCICGFQGLECSHADTIEKNEPQHKHLKILHHINRDFAQWIQENSIFKQFLFQLAQNQQHGTCSPLEYNC